MKRSIKTRKRLRKSPHAIEMNKAAVSQLKKASIKDVEAVYVLMESSKEELSQDTAEERSLKFGLNQVGHDKVPS